MKKFLYVFSLNDRPPSVGLITAPDREIAENAVRQFHKLDPVVKVHIYDKRSLLVFNLTAEVTLNVTSRQR